MVYFITEGKCTARSQYKFNKMYTELVFTTMRKTVYTW